MGNGQAIAYTLWANNSLANRLIDAKKSWIRAAALMIGISAWENAETGFWSSYF